MNPGEQLLSPANPLYGLRVQFARMLAVVGLIVAISSTIATFITGGASGTNAVFVVVAISSLMFVSALSLLLVNRGVLRVAAPLIVWSFVLITVGASFFNVPGALIMGMIAIAAASTLTARFPFIGAMSVVMGAFFYHLGGIVRETGVQGREDGLGLQLVAIIATLTIAGSVTRYFVTTIERIASAQTRSVRLLNATAEVGVITSKLLSLEDLFNRAVDLIRDRFAFYHVQVFLVDERREYANLVASTGEVGQKLLARRHRLRVGSQSVIGRVTQTGEPVVARDTDTDRVHAVNELLPNTRAELALPIIDNDVIIGALDVQSTRANAFDEIDIQALQIMANQLATAIRNARLFEEQKASVEENRRLLLDAERERQKAERLNSQLTRQAWQNYLLERSEINGVTARGDRIEDGAEWTDAMAQAVSKQRPVTYDDDGERIVAVPIVLRGQALGAIEVRTDDPTEAGERVKMLVTVAQRLATTIDNLRLFDEAQAATAQEARINEIVGIYQSTDTVEDLLRVTLSELGRTLNAQSGMIRLGIAPADRLPAAQNGHSGHNGHHSSNGSAD